MTPEELRSLDAYLAEKLFGLAPRRVPPQDGWIGEFTRTREWAAEGEWVHDVPFSNPEIVTAYSSTGDGMLAVLDAMRGRGWVGLVKWDGARNHAWFTALFSNPADVGRVDADTLPLAVARAAKAALEAKP